MIAFLHCLTKKYKVKFLQMVFPVAACALTYSCPKQCWKQSEQNDKGQLLPYLGFVKHLTTFNNVPKYLH